MGYLSLDRIKPPDVDLDIEDRYQPKVIEYVKQKHTGSVRVGTWSQLGISQQGKGSLMISWRSAMKRKCEKQARSEGLKGIGAKTRADELFKKHYDHVKSFDTLQRDYPEDYPGLKMLADSNSAYSSYGATGGGIVLSGDDLKIEDWVPTMLIASSETQVTQMDKNVLEELGILKLDLLSQSSLSQLKIAQESMGRENPRDLSWIPENDLSACAQISAGKAESGIFHATGYTKSKGYRELRPTTTEEVCIGTALFMPGSDDNRNLYIQRKNDPKARRNIKYLGTAFEKVLTPTLGVLVYQDQLVDIMRELGMTEKGVNVFMKVVKSSGKGAVEENKIRLKEVQEEFADLCRSNGISDPNAAWEIVAPMVAYSFGKGHSVGYGIRTYRSAYIKAYNPADFMLGLLVTCDKGTEGRKREVLYMQEAKRMGLKIGLPHVNKSSYDWVLDKERNMLIQPMDSVKGIGPVAAKWLIENQPFDSIDSLCLRSVESGAVRGGLTGTKPWLEREEILGSIKALRMAGALDGLFANSDRSDLEV
jgi:DNA polymerase-3 subunit alpha